VEPVPVVGEALLALEGPAVEVLVVELLAVEDVVDAVLAAGGVRALTSDWKSC